MEQFELHRVLRLMEEWRIQPNEITYEIIITLLARAQRLELALQYLAQLGRAGLSPTLKTASAIITTAAELGFPRLALDLALAFEETSVRRLDTEVWVDVLISSAEALYVSVAFKWCFCTCSTSTHTGGRDSERVAEGGR